MIKRSVCAEDGCAQYVFKKGKCQRHQPKQSVKRSRPETVLKKKALSVKRNEYFEYHIARCKYSEESLIPITNPGRSNICHILPKSTHESLGEDKRNFVYLTQEEHNRFDNLLFRHAFETIGKEFPRAWEIVKNRLKEVLPDCKENTFLVTELRKIL